VERLGLSGRRGRLAAESCTGPTVVRDEHARRMEIFGRRRYPSAMTLVYAQVVRGHVALLSDTGITFTESAAHERRGLAVALKTVILTPTLAVAYAGDIVRANIAVRRWRRSSDTDATIQHFAAAHREDGLMDPDFIVATDSSITRIRGGEVERNLLVGWLGDDVTFRAFQRLRSGMGDPWEQACTAFNEIIHDDQYPLVSGFKIETWSGQEGFKYLPSMGVTFDPVFSTSSTVEERLPTRTAAEGGYSYNVLTPREAGIGAIVLYFHQGTVGYLFYPRRCEDPFVLPNLSIREVVKEVRRRWAFSLDPFLTFGGF
jgi:hypothetical protein